MRVDIERLDELMNLAGQLAMGKARVAQVGARLKKALSREEPGRKCATASATSSRPCACWTA